MGGCNLGGDGLTSQTVEIQVNGAWRQVPEGHSVADFLSEFVQPDARVAVELNAMIVPRSRYGQTRLSAGDVLEVVHAVGGG